MNGSIQLENMGKLLIVCPLSLSKLDMLEKNELSATLVGILLRNKNGIYIRYVGKAIGSFLREFFEKFKENIPYALWDITPDQANDELAIVRAVNWSDQIIYVNDNASRKCSTFVNFAYRAMIAGRLKDEFSGMAVFEVLNKIKNKLPATPSYALKNSDE